MSEQHDPFDLTGKVAVVTGGSRGLGREMCLAFARNGADVVAASRKAEACEALAEEIHASTGREALGVGFHAGRWDDCDRLVSAVYERFGRVDVLVNNAGMSPLYPSVTYASAKAGLNNMTLGMARIFGPRVRVNCIMPGPFLTDISTAWPEAALEAMKKSVPLGRGGEPEEIVGAALYFASDASSFTTGAILKIDGGAAYSAA